MRLTKSICVLALGFVCYLFLTSEPLATTSAADTETVLHEAEPFSIPYVVQYHIGDLPIWSKNGKFEPELVMVVIETYISPKSWEAAGGSATIAPYFQNASLIITATESNHKNIEAFFKRFRR